MSSLESANLLEAADTAHYATITMVFATREEQEAAKEDYFRAPGAPSSTDEEAGKRRRLRVEQRELLNRLDTISLEQPLVPK